MRKWWSVLIYELRSIPWYLLPLPVVYGIWMFIELSWIETYPSESLHYQAYKFHYAYQNLSLGIAMFLGIYLLRRDIQRSSYEWLRSYPVGETAIIFSKYAAGWLYLSLYTAAMSLVYVIYAYASQRYGSWVWQEVLQTAVQYEWSYGVTLALGMALAACIPNRISYIIGFCAWMFGTYFLDLVILTSYQELQYKPFHLSQFTMESLYLNYEVWSPSFLREETRAIRWIVVAFIVMMLALMIVLEKRKRAQRHKKRWIIMLTVVIAANVAAYVPYYGIWSENEANVQAKRNTAPVTASIDDQKVTLFSVERYILEGTRTGNRSVLWHAELTVNKAELLENETIKFTLNRNFDLQAVWMDNKKLDHYQRQGDTIEIPYLVKAGDSEAMKIHFYYSGSIYSKLHDGSKELMEAFIDGDDVLLPAQYAWYPLPGEYSLYNKSPFEGVSVQSLIEWMPRSDFELRLQGFPEHLIVTGNSVSSTPDSDTDGFKQYIQSDTRGIHLLSGSFEVVQTASDPLKVIAAPSLRSEAEQLLEQLLSRKHYFESWLEGDLNQITQVVIVPFWQIAGWEQISDYQVMGNTLFISERWYGLDSYSMEKAIYAILFGDPRIELSYAFPYGGENASLIGEVRQMISYMYYRDALGESPVQIKRRGLYYLERAVSETDEKGKEDHFPFQMLKRINAEIENGNTPRVKQVLNDFYKQGLWIDPVGREPYAIITREQWMEQWQHR
ncbi:ABC transporter permease [Marinicrinis lubricantis]|uniref:ABC transporter permease n=1 Tax=Marinicrinis lubricantis TaxID=2086470 RepID=A0ABW1IK73_9BACL